MKLYLRLGIRTYEVKPPGGRIGSAPGLEVSLQAPNVLAEHAELSWDGQAWWVAQLGSESVYLNSLPLRLARERLGPQGTIQVGGTLLDFWRQNAEPPTLIGDHSPAQVATGPRGDLAIRWPQGLELMTLKQAEAVRPEGLPNHSPKNPGVAFFDPNKTIDSPVGQLHQPATGGGRTAPPESVFSANPPRLDASRPPREGAPFLDPNKTISSPVGQPAATSPIYPAPQAPRMSLEAAESSPVVSPPPAWVPSESPPQPPGPAMAPTLVTDQSVQPDPRQFARHTPAKPAATRLPPVPATKKQRLGLATQLGILLGVLALTCLSAFMLGMHSAKPIQILNTGTNSQN